MFYMPNFFRKQISMRMFPEQSAKVNTIRTTMNSIDELKSNDDQNYDDYDESSDFKETKFSHHQPSEMAKIMFYSKLAKYSLCDFDETLSNIQSVMYEANSPTEDRIVTKKLDNDEGYMLAVFDGHSGGNLADMAANNVHKHFQNIFSEMKLKYNKKQAISHTLTKVFNILERSFLQQASEELNNGRRYKRIGSCALCCILTKEFVIVANAGDSKALLVSKQNKQTICLNEMFNTHNQKQQKRLLKQFPKQNVLITNPKNGAQYLKGCLIPTRCLGDFHLKYPEFADKKIEFKQPYITHQPQIRVHQLNSNNKYYLVVGSDGLWDQLNDQQISQTLSQTIDLNKADALLDSALDKIASKNKMDVQKVRQIHCKKKRDFHDDISIIVADLQKIH